MVALSFILATGGPLVVSGQDGKLYNLPPTIGCYVYMHNSDGTYDKTGTVTDVKSAGITHCSYICPNPNPIDAYFIPTESTPMNLKLDVKPAFIDAINVTVKFDSHNPDDHIVSVFGVNVRISKAMNAKDTEDEV